MNKQKKSSSVKSKSTNKKVFIYVVIGALLLTGFVSYRIMTRTTPSFSLASIFGFEAASVNEIGPVTGTVGTKKAVAKGCMPGAAGPGAMFVSCRSCTAGVKLITTGKGIRKVYTTVCSR